MKRNKTVIEFIPKYNDLSIKDRKSKEFYEDKVINPKKANESYCGSKTARTNKEDLITEPLEKPSKVLSSLDVKLKQLYPDLSYVEIEKMKKKNITRFKDNPKVKCN